MNATNKEIQIIKAGVADQKNDGIAYALAVELVENNYTRLSGVAESLGLVY